MPTPAGNNDSILTFGLDMIEETEQNAGIILDGMNKPGAEAANEQAPAPKDPEAAELDEARAVAEDARQREQAEQEQERQQEQQRSR